MMVLVAIAVFAATTALDFAAARYTLSLRDERWHDAGLWSCAMCLLSTIALLALMDASRWMLVPELGGLYFGTRLVGWIRVLRSSKCPPM